jgi:hypothetical protein
MAAPTPQEVKWEDVDKKTQELTREEHHNLEQRRAAFDKLLGENKKAKYKIEVMFRHTRRTTGLIDGMLSVWESGTKLSGEGDAKLYFCPQRALKKGDCEAILPDVSNGFGHLVCPKCGGRWTEAQVFGEIFFKLPNEKWAEVLVRYYARTEHNADVYLKYPKHDVRKIAANEQAKQLGGEQYNKLRSEKVLYIYRLESIIKDTSNGSTLYDRFKALLTA